MKHDIRLVAIDLDGTLLNAQQKVSMASRAALQQTAQAGISTILVTGRDSTGAEMVLSMLGIDLPYVCSAGSLVRSGKGGTVISARPFHNPDELSKVIAYVRLNNDGLVADLPNGRMCWYGPDGLMDGLDPLTAEAARGSLRTFAPERDFDRPILKISIAGELTFLDAISADVLNGLRAIHHVYAGLHYVDLTAQGVNKGSALEIFAKQANIPPSEIAAIGDQPIDLPMFSFARLSIAMGNAPETVKKVADWTVPSNDADGVAFALMRILEDQS